MSAALM